MTRKDVYLLLHIDDILVALYFTSLDLTSGYWQIALDQDARQKSAFVTYNGMPFGLCNAPATFQRLMQRVLAGLEYKCCFVYLDDILRLFTHLQEVFTHF